MRLRGASLFSGGKDSTYATFLAEKSGINVEHLIIIEPERDSMMFHYPCIEVAEISAELMGKEYTKVKVSKENEEEMGEVKEILRDLNIEVLVSGAIASEYQRKRIEKLCKSLGILSVTPLWKRDPVETLREMVSLGFEIMVVGCFAEGMTRDFLGRVIDEEMIRKLEVLREKYGIHPGGEGGEFETLVLSGPHMKGRIDLDYDIFWRGDSGYLVVKEIKVLRGDSWKSTKS